MPEVTIEIDVPVINFDIIQGQDLEIPVEYTVSGVTNTMDGASLRMEVRTSDFTTLIDSLSTANTRLEITAANKFKVKFPKTVSSSWSIKGKTVKYIYGLELTTASGKTDRIFEGEITVKREQTLDG